MRKWQRKDKELRESLAKRLGNIRKEAEDILKGFDQKCLLDEGREVYRFIESLDKALDITKFTIYGYGEIEMLEGAEIEKREELLYEIMEEIENLFAEAKGAEEEMVEFFYLRAKDKVEELIREMEERDSLIKAFIPPAKRLEDEVYG